MTLTAPPISSPTRRIITTLSIFFPAANFTVEVYSSSGELVAEKPVFYENYAVGEKLRGTDTEQIHLYGLAPDTYTVVIKES